MSRITRRNRQSTHPNAHIAHRLPAHPLSQEDGIQGVVARKPAEHAQFRRSSLATTELLRAWKLTTLAIGIGALIWGSFFWQAPDWDIPISIVMALVAYVTAPWAMQVFITRDWGRWPQAIFATWFGVDGCYWLYWSWQNPQALELMRDANAPASLSMYLAVGLFWMPRCSLSEFIARVPVFLRGAARTG